MSRPVTVVGAGLAGSEATWQLVKQGIPVRLYEMRPQQMTPAHQGGGFAELVCSNSLRSNALENDPEKYQKSCVSGIVRKALRLRGRPS